MKANSSQNMAYCLGGSARETDAGSVADLKSDTNCYEFGMFRLAWTFQISAAFCVRSWYQKQKARWNTRKLFRMCSLSNDQETLLTLENDASIGVQYHRMSCFEWWKSRQHITPFELPCSQLYTASSNQLHNARPVCSTESSDPPQVGELFCAPSFATCLPAESSLLPCSIFA